MDRKERFRDSLIAWVKEHRKTDFNSLSPIDRSKEMTRFYVQEIVSRLTPGLIPEDFDDIDDYVVDGSKDGGVDFIFRSEGYVLIIQSKYHGSGKSEDQKEVADFCDVLQRIHDASARKITLNRKVMEVVSDIDWDNDQFDLRFCTVGKVADQIFDRIKKGANQVREIKDFLDRVELSLLDEVELNTAIREAISADKEPDTNVAIRFSSNEDGEPWIRFESESGRQFFIGQVTGAELSEIYRPHKYKLFSMNIRDYVGDTTTNKAIKKTALENPDDFVFFNNGVSAIATKVTYDEDDHRKLHCERFSIINGAQTVRSIVKAHKQDSAAVKESRVLLRVMTYQYNKDGEFLSDVTKYNNTQNSIKVSDFRSNDPVQKDLRTRFSRISVGAKSCEYKNKRKREPDSNRFSINMEEFAKTIHSFTYGPDDMFGGTKYLFDISPKGGYQKVFGETVSHLTEDEFEKLAGIYFLCYQVQQLWKSRREIDNEKGSPSPALERRWLVYYAVGELLRIIYQAKDRNLTDDLQYLGNPNKWINKPKHATLEGISEIFVLAMTALDKAYRKASKMPEFKHRNWFRSDDTMKDIKEELQVIPEYRRIEDLPLLRHDAAGATA